MVDLWSKCLIQKLWQIFKSIYMPNFIFFLRSSSISPIFILFYRFIQLENDLKWKNRCGPFSPRSAQLGADPGSSVRASRPASPLPRCCHWQMGPACQLPSSLKSSLAPTPRVVAGEFPVAEPSTHRFLLASVPPQQAELSFGPEAILKIKNSFSIFR
jgi:hypothetical protein